MSHTHPSPARRSSPTSALSRRLRGLLATGGLVAFVAGIPLVLAGIEAVPDWGAFGWSRLSSPDDGTLVLAVLTLVCWAAWALFTVQLVLAIGARLRGIASPHLPGLAVPQIAADRLVAVAALLFIALPATTAVLQQPKAEAVSIEAPTERPTAVAHPAPVEPASISRAVSSPAAALVTGGEHRSDGSTRPYVVKRGDSLWKIAQQHLGDGTRYVELVDLNGAVLHGQPDFLLPGTVLHLPATGQETTQKTTDDLASDGTGSPADTTREGREYEVQAGDTLSGIAQTELGDADAYPLIFEASRHTTQADGGRLTDPDLIRPGWLLTIPARHTSPTSPESSAGRSPAGGPTQRTDDSGIGERSPAPVAEPRVEPGAQEKPAPAPHAVPRDPALDSLTQSGPNANTGDAATDLEPEAEATPGWLLPGLAGASAIFGTSLWIALRQKRRTQQRFRRPGTIFAAPPEHLHPAEKTAFVTATSVAPRIDDLDRALRALTPPPRLVTAMLTTDHLAVRLAEPATLPTPWIGEGIDWRMPLDDAPAKAKAFPPYPLLVSVGRASEGAFVFVNLEELRTISVIGNPDRARGFARHLAAELAVNPWSIVTTVEVLGLGADLASFNLGRVRTHPPDDTGFLDQLGTRITELPDGPDRVEPDDFQAAIIATAGRGTRQESDQLSALAAAFSDALVATRGRTAAALVDVTGATESGLPGSTSVRIADDGRLFAECLGVDVAAASLSEDEARACALLLDLTLDIEPVPIPVDPDSDDTDLAGALNDVLTEPRPVAGPAGERSLLPGEAGAYVKAAATTSADIAALAPLATSEAAEVVALADPMLDEDLARWESPTLSATKLTLLGPVGARTTGDSRATAHRRPFYVELLAYLALSTHGVTTVEVAEAFRLTTDRARVDLSMLRRWLGDDPASGEPLLPNASHTPNTEGPARYRLNRVLCDLDLFRRLRARGQSRGADGMEDLIAALGLVSGEPFTQLREGHWAWLFDGERWDHIMTAAIVDVGHIVTTHALADDDHRLALWAAGVGYGAAPEDEVAQFDFIEAEKAAGHTAQAEADLREHVLNRRDDDLPPTELPPRSVEVMANQGRGSRPKLSQPK